MRARKLLTMTVTKRRNAGRGHTSNVRSPCGGGRFSGSGVKAAPGRNCDPPLPLNNIAANHCFVEVACTTSFGQLLAVIEISALPLNQAVSNTQNLEIMVIFPYVTPNFCAEQNHVLCSIPLRATATSR